MPNTVVILPIEVQRELQAAVLKLVDEGQVSQIDEDHQESLRSDDPDDHWNEATRIDAFMDAAVESLEEGVTEEDSPMYEIGKLLIENINWIQHPKFAVTFDEE